MIEGSIGGKQDDGVQLRGGSTWYHLIDKRCERITDTPCPIDGTLLVAQAVPPQISSMEDVLYRCHGCDVVYNSLHPLALHGTAREHAWAMEYEQVKEGERLQRLETVVDLALLIGAENK